MKRRHSYWFLPVAALLMLWGTRLNYLTVMPLHNDEGLHLTRAVEVWNLHPFWEISDGKIVNHWLIAAFYPQHAPVFVGRVATVFVAMIGLAAALSLWRRWFGGRAALLGAALWLLNPPLFFYERTALSDAEAGALGVLAFWGAFRLTLGANSGRSARLLALFTGLALAAAVLFKFTAAPFALSIALLVLLSGSHALRSRLWQLAIIAGVGVACLAVPVIYTATRGGFGVAERWLGGSGGWLDAGAIRDNAGRFLLQLTDTGGLAWSALLLLGLMAWAGVLLLRLPAPTPARRDRLVLLVAGALPLVVTLIVGREVMPRHTIAAVPILLVIGTAGLALAIERIPRLMSPLHHTITALMILWLAFDGFNTLDTAYVSPHGVALPPLDLAQFIYEHSAGFGLVDAVADFPRTVSDPARPILASMFPDSCRRANFYSDTYRMICTDAPGTDRLADLLTTHDRVYVLVESPPVGLDMTALTAGRATRIAGYPRPGETPARASVTLWEVRR
jgi:hypothetical protein